MSPGVSFFCVIILCYFVSVVQGVICLFYHLKSDCDYRLDGFAMSRIQATINECNDPVDITLRITCEKPKLDWSRTFTGAIDTEEVPGYWQNIYLQVKQQYSSSSKKYGIQVTVLSEKFKNVEIMNSTLKLYGESCSVLNPRAQIAVAILGTLAGLAVIGIIVVIILKKRRERALSYLSTPPLVQNAEQPENSFQANSTHGVISDETTYQNRPDFQDMVTYSGLTRNDHQRF
ncbi:uncharacterized protein LOC127737389 [Mytilus californianus]|uniref:uncharacterized protein LOC127737389 n=1 Tax=Mytilus californianus TaxID=6549 RepID=UPI00224736CB|nr:uncharacterized protein LOC127737389 [Mytilus californianus]XP_052103994.1 uncharacterized protein LOC127737389 [Mytilus californianus]XP_052103995.1 uncharacterized protein LOC127737389 [Mytilus californianus]XP_052103996.1 uncharacterized protein LOC127737389 [Mytilus californianus]